MPTSEAAISSTAKITPEDLHQRQAQQVLQELPDRLAFAGKIGAADISLMHLDLASVERPWWKAWRIRDPNSASSLKSGSYRKLWGDLEARGLEPFMRLTRELEHAGEDSVFSFSEALRAGGIVEDHYDLRAVLCVRIPGRTGKLPEAEAVGEYKRLLRAETALERAKAGQFMDRCPVEGFMCVLEADAGRLRMDRKGRLSPNDPETLLSPAYRWLWKELEALGETPLVVIETTVYNNPGGFGPDTPDSRRYYIALAREPAAKSAGGRLPAHCSGAAVA